MMADQLNVSRGEKSNLFAFCSDSVYNYSERNKLQNEIVSNNETILLNLQVSLIMRHAPKFCVDMADF